MRYLEIMELLLSPVGDGVGVQYGWTAAELSLETGLAKSSTYAYLSKLLRAGFVYKRGTLWYPRNWFAQSGRDYMDGIGGGENE